MGGYAWVTLATNDSYSLGALVLARSLEQVGTRQQLAVLITPGVSSAMRSKLTEVFNVVKEVNLLDSKDEANLRLLKRPELGITFTKLHCWRLTQFDKCVFLDADTLVLENCDELFEREELSAAPDVGWPDCFNSGVFVYRPSNETYEKLIQFTLEKGSFDGGDQGLLNLYFSDWAHKDISKHLPFIYNMTSTACYSYLPAFKQFGKSAKIIHFIGSSKPWLQYFDTETRKVHPSEGLKHIQDILQRWWNIFCTTIHPNLSAEMTGLAGAFAKLTLGAPRTPEQAALDDHLRRQGWEVGNIDYLGKDSFDNIWSKICETLSEGPEQPTPKTDSPPKIESKPSEVPPAEVKLDDKAQPIDVQMAIETPAKSSETESPDQKKSETASVTSLTKSSDGEIKVTETSPIPTPESVSPSPPVPEPITPATVTPEPVTPASVRPESITGTPETVTEELVASTPVITAPVVTAPVVPAPVVSAPVVSAPVVSAPVVSAPVVPAPVVSAPVVTAPVVTAPVVPAPLVPAPVVPSPVVPAPVVPAPVVPITVAPEPVASAPVAPASVAPAPVATAPLKPEPVTSLPVAPVAITGASSEPVPATVPKTVASTPEPIPAPVTPKSVSAPVTTESVPVPVTHEPVAPAAVTAEIVTPAPISAPVASVSECTKSSTQELKSLEGQSVKSSSAAKERPADTHKVSEKTTGAAAPAEAVLPKKSSKAEGLKKEVSKKSKEVAQTPKTEVTEPTPPTTPASPEVKQTKAGLGVETVIPGTPPVPPQESTSAPTPAPRKSSRPDKKAGTKTKK